MLGLKIVLWRVITESQWSLYVLRVFALWQASGNAFCVPELFCNCPFSDVQLKSKSEWVS